MYRKALQMQITTLLFAQDASIRQSQPPSRTLLNSFYSGLYKIMGFRHVINVGKSQSEFKLVKNAPKYDKEEEQEEEL